MSKPEAFFDIKSPEVDPPTPLEKLPQCAQDAIAAEERLRAERYGRYEANQAARDAKRVEIADYEIQRRSNDQASKPSKKVEDRLTAKIEKARAELKALDGRFELESSFRPGSMSHVIKDEFLNTPAIHKRYRDANITDDILPGKSQPDMVAHYREVKTAALADRKNVLRAPQTEAEIKLAVWDLVERHKATLSQTVSALRGVAHQNGRFQRRSDNLPNVRIVSGASSVVDFLDGGGLLFALFPELVAERLIALALDGHDEGKALDSLERTQRLQEIDCKISDAEFKAELWHRRCMASGENPGPRIGGSALPILGIIPV